jgi:hypothetical protein
MLAGGEQRAECSREDTIVARPTRISEPSINHTVAALLGELLCGVTMRGGCEGLEPSWPSRVPRDEEDRAEVYRRSAERLRELAAKVRFNFGRQQQLLSLADGFDRLAERVELSPE